MSTYQNNSNLMHNLHTLFHYSDIILGGSIAWVLAILGISIPKMTMLVVIASAFNIVNFIPWLQAIVLMLGGLVSILTLYKLALEFKWIGKKKK